MSIIMTIFSCVLFAQLSADQGQTGTSLEPTQQAASADDNRPSADAVPPPAQTESTPNNWTTQPETPAALDSPKSTVTAVERSSTSKDTAVDRSSTFTDRQASLQTRPPQLIAEAMTLPQGSPVTGQALQLVQALSATPDRHQQLTITHAYWQTVEAVAKYHYCLDHENQLGRLQARRDEEASLQAARSAATAKLREAELAAGSAQHELAVLLQFPPDAPLPFPADRPHVGAYRTNFQELFAARPAPDRARLIDRTLPIRRMAIDERAIAVQAAQDALTAAIDAYQSGQGSLTSVISNSDQAIGQQVAFIATVCRYNKDIAEYAITVAAPGATPQILAGYMIKTAREPVQTLIGEGEGEVRPTALNEPANTPATWDGRNQSAPPQGMPRASVIPTVPPATQWGSSAAPAKSGPTLARQPDGAAPKEKKQPTPATA